MAQDEIYTKDWAVDLVKELSKVSSVETQDEILYILQIVSNQLADFLGNFNSIRQQIENLNMRKTIVRKYRRQINSLNSDATLEALEETQENAQEIILYTNLLQQMIIGYYLINKIRDVFFEPITYAIGYLDENKELVYVENIELEDLLKGVGSLSTRIRLSEKNFARLEIDLKEVLKDLKEKNKTKQAKDDPLYKEIQNYTSSHKHTFMSHSGKRHEGKFAMGHLWETYRYMKLNSINFTDKTLQAIYEEVRRGNLAYYKGGDVLNEQDKFGTSVALTSMASIVEQIPLIIEALRSSNINQIASSLQNIFLQEITDSTDNHLQNYILKDRDKLLSVLKLK